MVQPYVSPTGNLRDDFYLRYGVYPTPMTDTRTGMMNIAQDALQAGKFVGGMMVPQDMTDLGLMVAATAATGPGGLLATPMRRAALGAGLMALDPNEAAAGPRRAASELLGLFKSTTPGRIQNATRKDGGYSVNLQSGETPSSGLMMGKYANDDPRNMVVEGPLTRAAIEQHALANRKVLDRPDHFFGTWRDPETGKTYLDVSQRFDPADIRAATKFGERTGQLAGYNVGAGATFPVGRLEDFVRGPEFARRQTELADQGYDYMRRMGQTPEWWPMRGTIVEDVYGTQNLPYISGYTASTAPNTPPRVNMQQASEYMRRQLVGEPIVQPDWRAPEGLLSLAPGKQMPLEQSRRLNLERTSRGDLDALSREKVNREGAALMGDPNAVVVDRWHIRTAEDPARGVYVAPQEGVIGNASNYGLIEGAISDIARSQGDTPGRFSSMSWTGARERARTTGDLYGVPYRAGSIPAESYGYPAHMSDLINAKAAQLGTSPAQVVRLLRAGAISLLSSAPVAVGLGAQSE